MRVDKFTLDKLDELIIKEYFSPYLFIYAIKLSITI